MTPTDPMIGRTVLGRYRVVRALAKGGMGVVYLARSEGAGGFTKPFVVKRMASDLTLDESLLKMFIREARIMSRLRHPGLVQVTDFGEEDGEYLMVLEYVHGFHLGQWHRFYRKQRGNFPAELLIHIVARVLDGLDYAHKQVGPGGEPLGIVHRDVSPSNILIDVEGHIKLADFGVARSQEHTEQTEETTIKGKMPYLAPELFRLQPPSVRSDVYACGVLMHEILVGKNEFRGSHMATTVSLVLDHVPTPIDAVRDDIPDGLNEVVMKALAKEPGDRFESASAFAHALRSLRELPEEEAHGQLEETAIKDFHDPAMHELLRVPSLKERDNAWRNPSAEILSLGLPTASSAPPTVAIGANKVQEEVSTSGNSRGWLWAILALVVLAGAGVATYFAFENPEPQPERPVFQVVGAQDSSIEAPLGDAGEEPTAEDASTPRDAEVAVGEDSGSEAARPVTLSQLTRAFNRQQNRIVACARRHSETAVSLTVRFRLAGNGRVESATVQPASVGSSPLGSCVQGVASGTRFPGPVPAELRRFSIPVSFSIQ